MPVRFQVDPDFYDHPKTLDVSDAAVALWTRAGSYSVAKLLDGFVPASMLARLSKAPNPEEVALELVREGLWKRTKGGFQFHQWEQRNPLTRARVEADRGYERDKKRRQRQSASERTESENVQPTNGHVPPPVPAGQVGDTTGSPGNVPPASVSVSVSMSESGSGHAANGGRPEPPARCTRHLNDPDPPPCGHCKDARQAHETWQANRRARLDNAAKCPKHVGQLAHNCALCRSERIATT